MPVTFATKKAAEKGTYVVEVKFYDEDDNLVAPNSAYYTLTDRLGTEIVARTEITSPTNTEDILLSGTDLELQEGETQREAKRVLTVEATYNSTLGNDLPLNGEFEFKIINLINIS